jgi:hypothetical protein
MSPGLHHVNYLAHDAAGNRAKCHFSVHVKGMYNHHFFALIKLLQIHILVAYSTSGACGMLRYCNFTFSTVLTMLCYTQDGLISGLSPLSGITKKSTMF